MRKDFFNEENFRKTMRMPNMICKNYNRLAKQRIMKQSGIGLFFSVLVHNDRKEPSTRTNLRNFEGSFVYKREL